MKVRLFVAAMTAAVVSFVTVASAEPFVEYRSKLKLKEYEARVRANGFDPDELCVHSIGQTHIDAAWEWRLAETHKKVFVNYGQAVNRMDHEPDFHFSGSSPIYYEWLKEDHPDIFARIIEREKEGQWEIVGGQYVEPDGNMPDGESFVRQRLVGQRFYLDHFGHISKIGWMLDSFGYHRNMPQIMKKSGAEYMWTSKLTWNDTTTFPFHNFVWRSPDGSELVTHICPIAPYPRYFPMQELGRYKDTRYLLKPGAELVADYSVPYSTFDQYLSDDWLPEVGVFYGKGDGGRGPTDLEVAIQKRLVEAGHSRFSTGEEFFSHIGDNRDRLPVWDDEMYLEYHRGVLTTHGWIKRANRKAEQMLRSIEFMWSAADAFGGGYPFERLLAAWKLMLLQQFHDILPGSSIPEVYADAMDDYDRLFAELDKMTLDGGNAVARLADTRPPRDGLEPVVVINTLGWERAGHLLLEGDKKVRLYDSSGAEISGQAVSSDEMVTLKKERAGRDWSDDRPEEGTLFRLPSLPASGFGVFFMEEGKPEKADTDRVTVKEESGAYVLENELVKVVVDRSLGEITSLVMKENGEEMLSGPSFRLLAYSDKPTEWPAWNINKNHLDRPISISAPTDAGISMDGPLMAEVWVKKKAEQGGRQTTFLQKVALRAGDPVVRLTVESDFHLHDALVKTEFNTVVDTDAIAADGPYMVVERPTRPTTPAEEARWEMACHKWIDLSDGNMGLALLNKGKYGFSLTEDDMGYRLTLIKGANHPRPYGDAENVDPKSKMFPFPTKQTDQGFHHIEMGLMLHSGSWREARLWEAGYEFNTPVETVETGTHKGMLGKEGSLVTVSPANVYIGSVKRAEDDSDLVIRLVEATGEETDAVVKLGSGLKMKGATETDLLELDAVSLKHGSGSVKVKMGPYEIKTLKVGAAK